MPMANYGLSGNNYAGGDYYRGDYYAAGGIFGSIKNALVGGVKGFISGGPLGAVKGAVGGALTPAGGKQKSVVPPPPLPMLRMSAPPPMIVNSFQDVPKGTPGSVKQPGIRGAIERALPFGQSGYVPGAAVGSPAPAGWHWNKSFSYARGLPPGSFLVRNRSMNPANARALRRSVRRQQGFIALARRVMKGTGMTIKRTGAMGGRKRGRKR